MKDVYDLLKELKNLGARIYAIDDKIKLDIKEGSLTSEISERIKYYRDDILTLIGETSKKSEFVQIEKLEAKESYPISDAQRRLWVLSQFEEGSLAYNMPGSIYLYQGIEIGCFKRAIESTIDRHEILRTVFRGDERGEIQQWILSKEDLGFKIDYKDYRQEENKELKVKEYITKDSNKGFDLENGPLLRASLLQVDDKEYVFYYNMHHIISDGWSMEVLSKDILSYYEGYKENKEPGLKELRIQYKDYSAWQLSQLEEESFKAHRDYWLNKLSGELPLLDLPSTKQRPRIKTHAGHTLCTYLNKELTARLKKYSEAKGGSLFMGLLASLNAILYRYSDQGDQVIGSPIAGREHSDLEDQIGFYVNTLALRTQIHGHENFDELFSKVKQNTLTAYTHQVYPFDRLVEELDLARDTSRSAVFDVMLALQNNGENISDLQLKEEELNEIVDHGSKTSKFDILINVREQGQYLSFSLEFNTDVYEREMIEGFIVHYKRLLSKLLSDPQQALGEIDYLLGEEREKLTLSFNNTKVTYSEKTVVDLFEEQVARTPDDVAVVYAGIELSYKDLNERSNRLSHCLRDHYGVSKSIKVGVMLDRSIESVIAMLGVMKTGACYVPIDHDYPMERVSYIIEDSSLEVIVSEEELFRKHVIKGSKLVDIKKIDLKAGKKTNLEISNHLEDGSYVIYTSGSTGQPKGVLQTHRMLSNLIQWDIHHSGIKPGLKHLQYASFSFDASLHDLYFVLSSGGIAYIVPGSSRLDYQSLKEEIITNKIEVLSMPFSALNAFCLEAEMESIEDHSIKYIVSTAEQLYVNEPLQKFLEKNPSVELHNHYGPSESHVVTSYRMSSGLGNIERRASIGTPISNSRIYILDGHQNLVPGGVLGELYIGGDNLAKGYLNKEDLTKERFVKDPFNIGELLYKTGDQGYWRSDGNIEFIGRKDDQVKIRGYRIELGEIEHALLRNEQVEEAVVLAKESQNNEQELVAYITSKTEQNVSDLRSYLKEILPGYMLPAYYVQLGSLPLNSNGKINKKALPVPGGLGLTSGVEYVSPRNEIEEKLVKIWEEILHRKSIGVKDDFFTLGGHSLKAVRLSNEYGKELSVKLSLKELFAHTSIESHAKLIQSSTRSNFIEIEKVTLQASYPISDAQRRLWVLSQFEEGSLAYNMAGIVYITEAIDIECFKRAIGSTLDRHEILRTVFREDGSGEIRQWILSKEDIGFKIDYKDYRQEENKELKVKEYITKDSNKGFDLENGPLLRAALIRVDEKEYEFYYNMHHIISDGWSMEVLRKDVFSYYESYKENKEPGLKELRIQYKDYSAWQLSQLEEESFKAHRDYWLNKLAGELPILDLPGSKPRPRIKTHTGYGLSTYLDKGTTVKLKKYTESNGGSLFMGLLACWNILMYRYTSQPDIIIGTPVAGREHADLEDQIGFYLNTLAFRNQVDPKQNFTSFYKEVKDSTLSGYTHQSYPFDRLVEELELVRDISRSPIFDILLDFHNTGEKIKDVEVDEKEINSISGLGELLVKYDLELHFREVGEHISIQLNYNADVYEKHVIEGIVGHYKNVIVQLVDNPGVPIGRVDFLSGKEKEELTIAFNDTGVNYPPGKTVLDLFAEQVEKTPGNRAIKREEKVLTYKELDELSNQLAHCIIKDYGIQSNDLLGIKLDKSEWAVIIMLGVLKTGAAYVPINPGDPASRKQDILSGSKVKLLITTTDYLFDEEEFDGAVFAVDVEFEKDNYSKGHINQVKTPTSLAYVMYTSGSTGRPKGVMIEHGSMMNYLLWARSAYGVGGSKPFDFGLFTSLSFDLTVSSIYLPLISGGELIIFDSSLDTSTVLKTYFQGTISCIKLTPAHINLVKDLEIEKTSIQVAIVGGDKLENRQVEILRKINPGIRIYNEYGPTECTVGSVVKEIGSEKGDILIGKPIANTQVYLLSEEGQLQPKGVVGEIWIGGSGLARGYLNREELTKERFITNPFKPGDRLYKTGDLGRWLPEGNIEYSGRKDDQVKIRGYRIELGDIEHALQSHEEIDEVVVITKENQNNEKELVAYITAKAGQKASDLRVYLKGLLPEYMLPSHYVQLEAMPLTSNGKVDKKSLPDPQGLRLASGIEYLAPRNEIEEKVIEILSDILGKPKNLIGVYDNFFDLGMNSIKLIRFLSLINKEFNLSLKAVLLFEYPSVDKLASYLRGESAENLENEGVTGEDNISNAIDEIIDLM
jgi:amino acid adenylation domain-containing protein